MSITSRLFAAAIFGTTGITRLRPSFETPEASSGEPALPSSVTKK
jgi:hypothetical protein